MAAIRYFVSNVDLALGFYRDRLGFKEVERWGPAFALVEHDGLSLWLSGPGTSAAKPMPDGSVPAPGGWNRIVVETDDIQTLVADLKKAGTRFRGELISGPGGQQVLIEDPDGNPVEVFQPGHADST